MRLAVRTGGWRGPGSGRSPPRASLPARGPPRGQPRLRPGAPRHFPLSLSSSRPRPRRPAALPRPQARGARAARGGRRIAGARGPGSPALVPPRRPARVRRALGARGPGRRRRRRESCGPGFPSRAGAAPDQWCVLGQSRMGDSGVGPAPGPRGPRGRGSAAPPGAQKPAPWREPCGLLWLEAEVRAETRAQLEIAPSEARGHLAADQGTSISLRAPSGPDSYVEGDTG